ncbi:unnamed protein product, partial [Amoebophrya sp. A120]|eukprot:GSA120T00007167001.1
MHSITNDTSYGDFNLNTHRSSFSANLQHQAPDLRTLNTFLEHLSRKANNNLLLG